MNAYRPAEGFAANPLRPYRNVACFCGSQKKAKRCHGKFDFLPLRIVSDIKRYLRGLSAAGIIEPRIGELK